MSENNHIQTSNIILFLKKLNKLSSTTYKSYRKSTKIDAFEQKICICHLKQYRKVPTATGI